MATSVPADAAGHVGDGRAEGRRRIFTIAQSCRELFSQYTSGFTSLSDSQERADLQQQRFYVWASYLGVFAPFNASLDKRLEYSDEIRNLVLKMLLVLQRNLDFLNSTDYNAPADSKVTSPAGLEGTPSQALHAIEDSIVRLNRLGVAIRKHSVSSLEDRINAFTQKHGDENYTQLARNIVQYKYKTATASLQEHLALSMASRRQKLRYFHRHESKLAGQIDTTSSEGTGKERVHSPVTLATRGEIDRGEEKRSPLPTEPRAAMGFIRHRLDRSPIPGERSDTNASNFALTPSMIARLRRSDSDSVVSSSNKSRTFMAEALEDYPKPPECKPRQPEPPCPYCCRPLQTHERLGLTWVRHVNKDLCPFVCLSEKCIRGPSSFQDISTWATHMRDAHTAKWPQQIHKPLIWACDVDHEMEEFLEKGQFQQHLASQHSDCTEEEMHAIAESCQMPRKRGKNICPICGYDLTNTGNTGLSSSPQGGTRESADDELTQLGLMEKHVAGHLRRLAIDSSRNLGDYMDATSEASLVTSQPDLADRDSKVRCPSGANLLDDAPLEFVESADDSRDASRQNPDLHDDQWSHSEFEVLLDFPGELSPLAAQEWSSKREEISEVTWALSDTDTSDPILMHFRSRQAPDSHRNSQIATESHDNENQQNSAATATALVVEAPEEKDPRPDKPSDSRQQDNLEDVPSGDEATSYSSTLGGNTESVSATIQSTPSADACRVLAYERNENFIHRPDINFKLVQLLPSNSIEFQSAALWGLGGSGKTQIALQYAYYRCRNPDCSVFWVHADTEATFTQDYKKIAKGLGLGNLLEGGELQRAVRRGIESQKRWVLVVDNADDLGLFGLGQASDKQQGTLLDSIPEGPNGTVLWTSRDRRIDGSLVGLQRGIQVGEMTVRESRELLEKRRQQVTSSEEVREVKLLLEELQWLPLAISQAGEYLYRTDTAVSDCLSRLKQEHGRWRVLGEGEFHRHRGSDAPKSVLGTWNISIHRLRKESQTGYRILHVLAFVDHQNIPPELLAAAAEHNQEPQTGRTMEREKALESAERRLKDFSFLTEHQSKGNGPTLETHKLLQDAVRYNLKRLNYSGQNEGYFANVALHVVDGIYPRHTFYNSETQGDSERYLTHALRVCTWAEIYGMEREAHDLQARVCHFLYSRGRWDEYRLAMETQLRLARKAFGEKHRQSIDAMLLLGWAFSNLERHREAEEYANKARRLADEALGRRDRLTLQCKRLPAVAYIRQGQFRQAKELLTRILYDARQFLEKDHELILNCMDDLARANLGLGEYGEASRLLYLLLDLHQDKYGQSHPHTLVLLGILGDIHYQQGQYDNAVAVQSSLLGPCRQSFGGEHPNTLTTMFSLALSRRQQGRKREAAVLIQECSYLRHKTSGADHPRTRDVDQVFESWKREDKEPEVRQYRELPDLDDGEDRELRAREPTVRFAIS